LNNKWCKPCQINNLKRNFTNWTSEDKIIDELIQSMQLKIENHDDIIVKWIPYNQLNNIKIVGKDNYNFDKVYSAIWNIPNKKVILKFLYKSQNITDELLNEV
jgi:hypothetical protein